MERRINQGMISDYMEELKRQERSPGTVEKYGRDIRAFAAYMGQGEVTREAASEWKTGLLAGGYSPVTVNSMLSAVNGFFGFLGWEDCRVKFLKIQRSIFRDRSRSLTREEYLRLLQTAESRGRRRLELIMETICATGIRVSELRYITLEAAKVQRAQIWLKGKARVVMIPGKLARKLVKYARAQKITSGEIFLTRGGKSMSRRQIWAEMKTLCGEAGVEASKVFPHNLRHLFATVFYNSCKDIVKLADVLGHSSVETTRIYLVTPGDEHARLMEGLGLVS